MQQQALKDFAKAKNARFASGFGEPTWRKKYRHEGFRVIGTDRVPEYEPDGSPKLNPKTGKQVMGRSVVVHKLNRRWAQAKVPGRGWVRLRLTRSGLPSSKTFRITFNRGILAQGRGQLRQRTEHKAPGRVEGVSAPGEQPVPEG
ncbi:hypothetical protein [Streptomyces halobius]|uniref:Uncharacterized protein n=1 Tax=Streptomyces halobius TaxID=2879846 RepID=A0ABY4M709_9ACTN|nr:hypothetical protein [Streptomyces halobius]UQA93137.1 hypothetical protein K9S39_15935 [Streptomyces halobius]